MAFTRFHPKMDTLPGRRGWAPVSVYRGTTPKHQLPSHPLHPPVPWQGHAAPILYAVWAEAGFLPEVELLNLRKITSDLDGHPVPVSASARSRTGLCLCFCFPRGQVAGGRAPTKEPKVVRSQGV